jgi:hypothetical protein
VAADVGVSELKGRRGEQETGRQGDKESPSSFILHPSSFILHPSSFILHPSSFILHPSSFILHPSSFIISETINE